MCTSAHVWFVRSVTRQLSHVKLAADVQSLLRLSCCHENEEHLVHCQCRVSYLLWGATCAVHCLDVRLTAGVAQIKNLKGGLKFEKGGWGELGL